MHEDKGKILIAGSLLLTVVAASVMLLFVLPLMTTQGRSEAQEPGAAPGGAPEPGAPPGGPGGPPPGGPEPGMPPGGPGSPPVGGPGAPPGGPGSPPVAGGPGGASGAGAAGAPAAATPADTRPLEGFRPNPFIPPGLAVGAEGALAEPPLTYRYGANWHRIPVTMRFGFPRPRIPARAAPPPPPAEEEPAFDILITSILWTQDGQAMATYEGGGKSGVVKPGDVVGDWQVVEIRRDYVVIADRKTNRTQKVYLTTKAPVPARPARPPTPPGGAQPGARPGRRPGVPGGGAVPPPGVPGMRAR